MKTDGKKEVVYAVFFSLASKAITYILLLVFANLYSKSQYGQGSFVFNLMNIIVTFTFIGLPDALVPFIIKKKNIKNILNTIFWFNLVIFAIVLVISIFYSWTIPLILTFPVLLVNNIATAFLRSKSMYGKIYRSGLYAVITILVAAYLLKDYGRIGVVSAYALGNVCYCLSAAWPLRKEIWKASSFKMNFKGSGDYVRNGATIAIIGSLFMFVGWVNSTLLGIFGNYEQVAQFGIASSLAGIIILVPVLLAMFVTTRTSEIKKAIKSAELLDRAKRVSFFGSLLASVAIATVIPLIIKIFFPVYRGIEIYIVVLMISAVFYSVYYVIYGYLIAVGKLAGALRSIIIGIGINCALAAWLIPHYGVLAVAGATAFSNFVILLMIDEPRRMTYNIFVSVFATVAVLSAYYLQYFGVGVFLLIWPLSVLFRMISVKDMMIIFNTGRSIVSPVARSVGIKI